MSNPQVTEIIKKAHKAFKRADKITQRKRDSENEIKALCQEYSSAMRVWNWQPHMLRQAVETRLGKKIS
jgi:hypothetical protein